MVTQWLYMSYVLSQDVSPLLQVDGLLASEHVLLNGGHELHHLVVAQSTLQLLVFLFTNNILYFVYC